MKMKRSLGGTGKETFDVQNIIKKKHPQSVQRGIVMKSEGDT